MMGAERSKRQKNKENQTTIIPVSCFNYKDGTEWDTWKGQRRKKQMIRGSATGNVNTVTGWNCLVCSGTIVGWW
jgi:hypothetical protein